MNSARPVILVADDEPETCRYLAMNLDARNYSVLVAKDGAEALKLFAERPVDLVLLDILMPGPDGYLVCRHMRETSDVPIIMLSALSEEHDKVAAFELGADDYLTKPFSVAELIARVRAALRRGRTGAASRGGDIELDLIERRAWVNGEEINLTRTEFSILSLMLRNPGRILTRRFILETVWGSGYENDHQSLRAYIYRLRMKLGDDGRNPRYIHSVSGVGYVFENGPAADGADDAADAHPEPTG